MTSKEAIPSAGAPPSSAECLTLEQLIAYTEGKVPLSERVKLEYHIRSCELCTDAVEGMSTFSDTGKVVLGLQDLKRNFDTQTQRIQRRKKRWKIYGGISFLVLIFLIAAISGYLLCKPEPADRFLIPYPNMVPMVRSQIPKNQLLQAMLAYEKGNYDAAVVIFDAYLNKKPENVTANFYAGISRLLNDDPQGAVGYLLKVQKKSENPFAEPAGWYLGLTYWKMKNFEAARMVLTEICAGKVNYHFKCEEVLSVIPAAPPGKQK